MNFLVKKIFPDAQIPQYGSEFSAGLDIFSYENIEVQPFTREIIGTGICINWKGEGDKNCYLRIASRSGLAAKYSIDIEAGVVDFDYTGEIKVVFANNGKNTYKVSKGDKIAQLILQPIIRPENILIVEELADTERGSGGFGSTGR